MGTMVMKHILGLACAAGLAGCVGTELVERKVMASNMPVRFNYRSLMNDQAEYQGADPLIRRRRTAPGWQGDDE